jgi:hypothetical protein
MRAPRSLMDTIGPDAIAATAKASPLQAEYGQTIDRDSAYERLQAKLAPPPEQAPPSAEQPGQEPLPPPYEPPPMPAPAEPDKPGVVSEVLESSAFKSFIRSAASAAGREISRSIFGTGRRRRRR